MAMKASAKRTSYFLYPVELVWKSIGAGDGREVTNLTEEEFNKDPAPNMIYTKSLVVTPNEEFTFQMKSGTFNAIVSIKMQSMGPCETKVVFSEQIEYLTAASYILNKFGLNVREELKSFSLEIHKRLDNMKK